MDGFPLCGICGRPQRAQALQVGGLIHMKWIEAAFRAPAGGLDALCDALTDLGADGLVIEDEADFRRFLAENRQYWDYVDEDLESRYSGVSRVKVYVADDTGGRARLARWTEALGIEPETRVIADEDWADNWKQYYKPIPIGETLLVLPKWEPEPEGNTRKVLKLDPGLAFGTGGHATTRMCLEFLEGQASPGSRVLDLGCGSGILGIGALVLGCGSCTGCDIDPKSPEAAADNAALNGIAPDRYRMYTGDVLSDRHLRARLGTGYDIVLANIVSDVIIPLAPYARECTAPGGVFIASGIIEGRQDEVAAAIESAGFTIRRRLSEEGWHAFLCE